MVNIVKYGVKLTITASKINIKSYGKGRFLGFWFY